MKRIQLLLLLCFVFSVIGKAQSIDRFQRFAVLDSASKKMWGCIERSTGDTIFPATFNNLDRIRPYGAKYRIGQNWGLLDSNCNIVFEAGEYRNVKRHFLNGRWYWHTTNRDYKNGLYDASYNEVLPEAYKTIQPLNHLIISVQKDSLFGLMNSNFELIIPYKYHYFHKMKNGYSKISVGELSGFINDKGKEIITPNYKCWGSINSGRLCVYENRKDGNMVGYLDTNDRLVIPFKFIQAFPFNNGYARAYQNREQDSFPRHGLNLKPRLGLIDTNGSWVIEPKYDHVSRAHKDYWVAYNNGERQDTFPVENMKPLPDYYFAEKTSLGIGKKKNLVLIMHQEGGRYGMKKGIFINRNLDWEINKLYWITNLENDTLTKEPYEYVAYNSDLIFLKHFRKWKYYDEHTGKIEPVRKLKAPYHIVSSRPYDKAPERLGVIRKGRFIVRPYFDTIELINGELICENERVIQQYTWKGRHLRYDPKKK